MQPRFRSISHILLRATTKGKMLERLKGEAQLLKIINPCSEDCRFSMNGTMYDRIYAVANASIGRTRQNAYSKDVRSLSQQIQHLLYSPYYCIRNTETRNNIPRQAQKLWTYPLTLKMQVRVTGLTPLWIPSQLYPLLKVHPRL